MKKKINSKYIAQSAIIGAIYATLTLILSPVSYGMMQIRLSEALIVLSALSPAAVPGLTLGCFAANIMGPGGLPDMVFGTLATFLGAWLGRRLRRNRWLVPLPNVVFNGLIIGALMKYCYGLDVSLWAACGWIALGEGMACFGVGIPLLSFLEKRKGDLKL